MTYEEKEKIYKKKIKPFLSKGSDYQFSLSKFINKKIVDVIGYPSDPYGNVALFQINKIIFDDGTELWVEGEHDCAYIPADDRTKELSTERLEEFMEPNDDDEEEES